MEPEHLGGCVGAALLPEQASLHIQAVEGGLHEDAHPLVGEACKAKKLGGVTLVAVPDVQDIATCAVQLGALAAGSVLDLQVSERQNRGRGVAEAASNQ